MRRVWDALVNQGRDKGKVADMTWAEARKALKGDDRESLPDYTDEMRQAQGRELGRLLRRQYATRLRADVLAMGIESYRDALVQGLIEQWAEHAVAYVDELRESGELAVIMRGETNPAEPDPF